MTIAKSAAWLLLLLCTAPITAPFSARSIVIGRRALAQSHADEGGNDAIALERSTFHSECRAYAGATVILAAVVNITFVRLDARAGVLRPSRPTRAVVLRV